MTASALSLAQLLARRTGEGELYERLENARVRCVACGHRCLIPPGREGICRVRFNQDGVLRVPHGYVAGLHLDPVEKKPFFHALPGSKALSFGMLGCDFHCGYCFTGDTIVATATGPVTFADLHESCERRERRADAELAYPEALQVVAGSGSLRRVRGVVRHHYAGDLVRIRALYQPPVRCTPDHRVYATRDARRTPEPGSRPGPHSRSLPRHPSPRDGGRQTGASHRDDPRPAPFYPPHPMGPPGGATGARGGGVRVRRVVAVHRSCSRQECLLCPARPKQDRPWSGEQLEDARRRGRG